MCKCTSMLTLPQEPCKIPTKQHPKSSGRALTLEQQLAADDAKALKRAQSNQKQGKEKQSTVEPAQMSACSGK